MNKALMFISRELVSYRIFIRAKAQPSLEQPPSGVRIASSIRAGAMETAR